VLARIAYPFQTPGAATGTAINVVASDSKGLDRVTDSILHRESFRAGLPAPMMIPVAIAIAIVVIAIAIAAVGTTIRFADPVLK
jgi:hypothetical protein